MSGANPANLLWFVSRSPFECFFQHFLRLLHVPVASFQLLVASEKRRTQNERYESYGCGTWNVDYYPRYCNPESPPLPLFRFGRSRRLPQMAENPKTRKRSVEGRKEDVHY
ncbi:hypothetical protein BHM03_00022197 [Ensete ventricosum]|nr:hypothetical protein BHM03_00022197 [Ensete ventricosum]